MKLSIRAFCIMCLTPGFCFGALAWDARRVEVTAPVESKEATVVFHFKNEGKEPVTITAVKPSCGCTTVDLAKRTYAPGETGDIKTVTSFGDSVGTQEKTVDVTTSDAPANPVTLVVRVTLPQLFTYSARLLLWRLHEDPSEKSTTVTCLKDLASIQIGPKAPADITCRVEPLDGGKQFRIFARPKSCTEPQSIQVPLVATLADHTTRPLSIFVLVR